MAHFAAQRLVIDCGRVVEIDVAHVHPVAGLDEKRQRHGLMLVVDRGDRIDLGEGIAVRAQPVAHQLLGGGDQLARISVAGFDKHQPAQLLLGYHHGAGKLDLAHLEYLALGDVHGDVHVVFFGRDRHLRRFDLKIRVAPIHVIGPQFFQIARQGLARVPVILLIPGQPIRRLQLKAVEDVFFLEFGVADNVDLLDLGALAFLDVDDDVDFVAGQIGDLGIDAHGVFAAAEILIGEVLLHLIEHRAIESLAGREADVAQALLQVFRLDVLVAFDLELGDGGTLHHHHEKRVAVAAQFHVAEESGRVQGTHRFADARAIQVIADVDRQIVEYRALGDALQTLDANVADGKSLLSGLRPHSAADRLAGQGHQQG